MLRDELYTRTGIASSSAFQFLGERCDRTVRIVLDHIEKRETLRTVSEDVPHRRSRHQSALNAVSGGA
jgi:hypothetical protein